MELINVADLIIINDKNQVLLAKRKYEGKFCWSIPGGRCEAKETFEEAIHREIKEELGCEIKALDYFKSYYLKKSKEKHYRVIYFYGKIKGRLRLNDELEECRWFDIDNTNIYNINFFLNQKKVISSFIKFYNKSFHNQSIN